MSPTADQLRITGLSEEELDTQYPAGVLFDTQMGFEAFVQSVVVRHNLLVVTHSNSRGTSFLETTIEPDKNVFTARKA